MKDNEDHANLSEQLKTIINLNLKCIKNLFDIAKSEKNIMEERSITLLIQDSIIWCFNTLIELIETGNWNKSASDKTEKTQIPTKEQVKIENQVIIFLLNKYYR